MAGHKQCSSGTDKLAKQNNQIVKPAVELVYQGGMNQKIASGLIPETEDVIPELRQTDLCALT